MLRPVIVLEFNELTPDLMDQFIAEGRLPNFKRLKSESVAAVTDAKREEDVVLNPWIQWVTVHTGHPFGRHGVFHLSDGARYKAPRIWDIVDQAGGRFWLCGSMNIARQNETVNGLALPDPWATDIKPYPADQFKDYQKLIATYVQQYTADNPKLKVADYLQFARFMVLHGLTVKTVLAAVRQIISEGKSFKWRRACILDRLQWDVFKHYYRKLQPTFSTFFLNSTAHFQHFYWRNMDAAPFAIKPSIEDQHRYEGAIRYGYEQMDQIVGECLDMASPDATIILCTALSQQPMLTLEAEGGKQLFRPIEPANILKLAGLDAPFQFDQVMSDKFYLTFADGATTDLAAERLGGLTLDTGAPFLRFEREGNRLVVVGAVNQIQPPERMVLSAHSNNAVAFNDLVYPIHGIRSGMHHQNGILWIRTPERRHALIDRRVSLCEIAPTILDLCGIDPTERFEFAPMKEVSPTAGGHRRELAA